VDMSNISNILEGHAAPCTSKMWATSPTFMLC
jgi:hypothetical protein